MEHHARRTRARLIVVMGMIALLGAVTARRLAAQEPGGPTFQPGSAAIWADRGQYRVGDPLQICYRIPAPGAIAIVDLLPNGTHQPIYNGHADVAGCVSGTVTPPTGQECVVMTYPLLGGSGTVRTCFQVVGATPPRPTPAVSVHTDRSSYTVGDPITICYRVPAPGQVTITDVMPDGRNTNLLMGFDDGTGGCLPNVVTPPAGTECLRLAFIDTRPGPGAAREPSVSQTCFQVIDRPAPAPWTDVGAAPVSGGVWNFDGRAAIDPRLTHVRVTAGDCQNPADWELVWDGILQPESNSLVGAQAWRAALNPLGPAVQLGVTGFARLSRPVVPNPVAQIDVTLFGFGQGYDDTPLTVCFRAP